MKFRNISARIADYQRITNRLGLGLDLTRLYREGFTKEEIVSYVLDKMRSKLQIKKFDATEKFKDFIYQLAKDNMVWQISAREKETEQRIRHDIGRLVMQKGEKVYCDKRYVGRIPKTVSGAKCAVTYYKRRGYSKLTQTQKVKLNVAMDKLRVNRLKLKDCDVKRYLEFRIRVKKR